MLKILVAAAALAGCASTGVVLVGAETYLIRKHDSVGLVSLARPLLADLHDESESFCLQTGRAAETVKESESSGVPLLSGASAELRFRCVAI